MIHCRVCDGTIADFAYESPAPVLTSIMTLLDSPKRVFICENCGHTQSDDLSGIQEFYDTAYRISLSGEDHDQIVAVEQDGTILYRTDHQARIALRLLNLPTGASVLDYGAAKADTLRKMQAARPDVRPYVFDVSADYSAAWKGWVPEEGQAIYSVPPSWTNLFDVVMSHFVIEHVANPVGMLRDMAVLLRPGGTLLLSLPNVSANPGDMMVGDHLSHFSEASLRYAIVAAGFAVTLIDTHSFPGAFFVLAIKNDVGLDVESDVDLVAEATRRARQICGFWEGAITHIDQAASRFKNCKTAIYGAGFYGSWLHSRIGKSVDVQAFLDRNPHLRGTIHFGAPVILPEEIFDDTELLFIGLNPIKARDAIASQSWLHRPGLKHIWLTQDV